MHPAVEKPIPAWVAVGGTPESIVRAAKYGMPVMLAIIGGHPSRFTQFTDLHRRALKEYGHPPKPVGVHSPGYIAETDEQARDEFFPYYAEAMDKFSRGRGGPKYTRDRFEIDATQGALMVGSPSSVAPRIASTLKTLGASRFSLKYSSGHMPHELAMNSVDLYGREVARLVKELMTH